MFDLKGEVHKILALTAAAAILIEEYDQEGASRALKTACSKIERLTSRFDQFEAAVREALEDDGDVEAVFGSMEKEPRRGAGL